MLHESGEDVPPAHGSPPIDERTEAILNGIDLSFGEDAAADRALASVINSAAKKAAPEPLIRTESLLEHAFWLREAQASTRLPYVVKGVFGRGHIIVFWGPPGSGKTFVAMDMACHIGAGLPWHGRRAKRGVVMYVAAESSRIYIENRIAAIRIERPELVDSDVLFVPLALDLLHTQRGDVDRVIDAAAILARDEAEVCLVVIDTLAVTFGGGDENAPADMGLYVSNIQHIRDKTGAAVLVVHHTGKDEARGMRGHSSLLGALDAELAIEGKPGEDKLLRTGKVRDGDGYTDLFAFRLERVELGIDDDGDLVTTCVVAAADQAATERARRDRKAAGLGKHQKAVLVAVEAAGGRLPRMDLLRVLHDAGMAKNRAYEALGALLDSGMLVTHNGIMAEILFPG
jgi:hypothetical protein